ncbi:hypothetical protein [Rhizobium leguminosarum]|uniref:hypothetical protein n=1 Tax=Rhizobium leguminosarum TaxID=384 RepID=UPI0015FE09ED|nr:hypothetical protein [Rhizobium leguminosarum]MBA9034321.1 hypothetical protein [Rhizobium leguminosarum]
MSDFVIPAIVLRVGKVMPVDDLNALITDIKMRAKRWEGAGEYDLVLNFCYDENRRGNYPLGPKVPYDPAGMDQILLDLQELTSVQRFHAYDVIDGRKHEKKWKTGMTAPKPKPLVDPNNILHGHDITKVKPELRFMLTEDGPEIDARNFAAALEGYPFVDKSAIQNRDYIEMEVIAPFEHRYPFLADLNRLFGGKIIRELRALADVKNQQRLPKHWHQAFGRAFVRGGNNPATYEQCCNFISGHFVMLERIAAKGKVTPQPSKIASRFTELAIETDHITAAAIAFG